MIRTKVFTTIALATALTLSACSGVQAPEPTAATTPPVAVQEPAEAPAPVEAEPVVEEAPEPALEEPTVPEYSQVIDGILYEGTEKAPVRIGNDVPGEAPAHQAHRTTYDKRNAAAQEAGKYIVQVGKGTGGLWYWGVAGESRHGSFRGLSLSSQILGDKDGYYPDQATAMKQEFIIDGRVLDRAEYVLLVQEGMEFVYGE